MEFLSSNYTDSSHSVFLVMQTSASAAAGYDATDTSTYQIAQLPFTPDTEFHEYRFDWTPTKVDFYADGEWLKTLYWTYPMASGHLSLNHWSNGNTKWSQGPPTQDAVLVVKYVKAYFNTTDDGKNEAFEEGCYLDRKSTTCQVPDDGGLQVPSGGNLSTFFFDRGMCGEKISAKGTASISFPLSSTMTITMIITMTVTMATTTVGPIATTTQTIHPESTPANTLTSSLGAASGTAQRRATATALSWFFLVSIILWWVFGEVLCKSARRTECHGKQ